MENMVRYLFWKVCVVFVDDNNEEREDDFFGGKINKKNTCKAEAERFVSVHNTFGFFPAVGDVVGPDQMERVVAREIDSSTKTITFCIR